MRNLRALFVFWGFLLGTQLLGDPPAPGRVEFPESVLRSFGLAGQAAMRAEVDSQGNVLWITGLEAHGTAMNSGTASSHAARPATAPPTTAVAAEEPAPAARGAAGAGKASPFNE